MIYLAIHRLAAAKAYHLKVANQPICHHQGPTKQMNAGQATPDLVAQSRAGMQPMNTLAVRALTKRCQAGRPRGMLGSVTAGMVSSPCMAHLKSMQSCSLDADICYLRRSLFILSCFNNALSKSGISEEKLLGVYLRWPPRSRNDTHIGGRSFIRVLSFQNYRSARLLY